MQQTKATGLTSLFSAARAHQAPQFCALAPQEEPGQAIPAALQHSHQAIQQRNNARLGYTHQAQLRDKNQSLPSEQNYSVKDKQISFKDNKTIGNKDFVTFSIS